MKKQLLLLPMLLVFIQTCLCNDSICSKIVFYREPSYVGSAISFPIMLNDSVVVRLKNNSYYTYECNPGEYTISVKNVPGINIPINIEANKTYYLRFMITPGVWSSVTEAILVDSTFAKPAIYSGLMRNLNDYTPMVRPKNRIGFNMAVGFGFDQIPVLEMENGEESNLSYGGGFGFSVRYGYELTKLLDLAFDLSYQFSELSPTVKNGSVNFSRGIFSVTPSFIIPIKGGELSRIKLGGGLDAYFGNSLDMKLSRIQDGFNDTFKYKSAMGYHISGVFEWNAMDRWSYTYGLKWYRVGYQYQTNYESGDDTFLSPDGSGIDMTFGACYHF